MTVETNRDGVIELTGACDSADAEVLLNQLIAAPGATVDWRACDTAHTAVVQVLLAASVTPIGPARGRSLKDMVEPLLRQR